MWMCWKPLASQQSQRVYVLKDKHYGAFGNAVSDLIWKPVARRGASIEFEDAEMRREETIRAPLS